jgi:hypothetical protein
VVYALILVFGINSSAVSPQLIFPDIESCIRAGEQVQSHFRTSTFSVSFSCVGGGHLR